MKSLCDKVIVLVKIYLKVMYRYLIAIFYSLRGKGIFVYYFSDVKNVGDILNVDLVEHYSGKPVINVPIRSRLNHCLVIGSVLQNMTSKSRVFGSGLIDASRVKDIKNIGEIESLRGHLTKQCLEQRFEIILDVPLGDPALLLPRIYNPNIEVKYCFGLVLHYVDENHFIKNLVEKMGGKVVSVQQSPRSFVNEIKSCKCILSSAMHGLILSDAYDIPNKKIILSNNLVGGGFKFKD